MLYTANLTNEDIFDFAFYHQLPADSHKKQYLLLGSDNNGKPYFEIKDAGVAQNGNNLERFVKNLNLTDTQHHEMDSILASYANDLQAQVLVNEKNTVAINPNIWNFNKALTMDLVSFAQKINKNVAKNIVPPGYNPVASAKAIAQIGYLGVTGHGIWECDAFGTFFAQGGKAFYRPAINDGAGDAWTYGGGPNGGGATARRNILRSLPGT